MILNKTIEIKILNISESVKSMKTETDNIMASLNLADVCK